MKEATNYIKFEDRLASAMIFKHKRLYMKCRHLLRVEVNEGASKSLLLVFIQYS